MKQVLVVRAILVFLMTLATCLVFDSARGKELYFLRSSLLAADFAGMVLTFGCLRGVWMFAGLAVSMFVGNCGIDLWQPGGPIQWMVNLWLAVIWAVVFSGIWTAGDRFKADTDRS